MNAKEGAAANLVVELISLEFALAGVMIIGTVGAVIVDAAAHVVAVFRHDTDIVRVVEPSLSLSPVTHTV